MFKKTFLLALLKQILNFGSRRLTRVIFFLNDGKIRLLEQWNRLEPLKSFSQIMVKSDFQNNVTGWNP